jgi:hypothetical protein
MIESTVDQDRDLLTRVLQSMSAQISGEEGVSDVNTFLPSIDEPDPPMEADEVDQLDETVDDDEHEHGDGPSPKPKRASAYAWGDHENGRIPTKALKAIGQGSHRLETGAADAWTAMREAAAADGVALKLTDSYRSFDQQVSVRQRKSHQVATAKPGTSVHGWGRAVDADVNDRNALTWLRANAGRYGWVNPAWAQKGGKSYEPWHWEFVGGSS